MIWLNIYDINLDVMETTTELRCFSKLFLIIVLVFIFMFLKKKIYVLNVIF